MTTYVEVTKDKFYDFVMTCPVDIHPHIVGGHDSVTGYTQEWRTQRETPTRIVGKSQGIKHLKTEKYWLVK